MKRAAIIFIVALPFIVSIVFLVAIRSPAPVLDGPLPNPNGYDKFVKAGEMVQGQPGFFETMTEDDLASLVTNNAEALALAQSALTNECRVPVKYLLPYDKTKNLVPLRNLAQTMTAEGRLAELRGRPVEALNDYLDVVHFGIESGRGGLLIDALIGVAIEQTPQNYLTNLEGSLDATSSRDAATALESFDSRRQSWDDVIAKEAMYRLQAYHGLKIKLMIWWYTRKDVSETQEKAGKLFRDTQKQTRILATEFAVHAYKLDKGKPPASIADLVPGYLKAIPKDPTTGKDMVYPP